jgi:GH18 family chitinase
MNIDSSVEIWIKAGVSPHKLILGLSTYGRSFRIKQGFQSCPLIGTPTSMPGTSGPYTMSPGFLCKIQLLMKK